MAFSEHLSLSLSFPRGPLNIVWAALEICACFLRRSLKLNGCERLLSLIAELDEPVGFLPALNEFKEQKHSCIMTLSSPSYTRTSALVSAAPNVCVCVSVSVLCLCV